MSVNPYRMLHCLQHAQMLAVGGVVHLIRFCRVAVFSPKPVADFFGFGPQSGATAMALRFKLQVRTFPTRDIDAAQVKPSRSLFAFIAQKIGKRAAEIQWSPFKQDHLRRLFSIGPA